MRGPNAHITLTGSRLKFVEHCKRLLRTVLQPCAA